MRFLLNGDPDAVKRVEKGTEIFMEAADAADSISINVEFHQQEH